MRLFWLLWFGLMMWFPWDKALFQTNPPTATPTPITTIISPTAGQAIQGKITIKGRTPLTDLSTFIVEFAYTRDTTDTWFYIAEGNQPVFDSSLAEWDSTTITDGDYTLRLTIHLTDGTKQTVIVPNLRVRNYSPVETSTPGPTTTPRPTSPGEKPTSPVSPTSTSTPIPPSLTPFPTNPAELTTQDLTTSLSRGIVSAFAALVLLGIYIILRKPLGK